MCTRQLSDVMLPGSFIHLGDGLKQESGVMWKQQLAPWLIYPPPTPPPYLLLPPGHVSRLLGVERIGDAAHDEHVQLESLLLLLFLPLHFLQVLLLLVARHRRAGAGGSDSAAVAAVGPERPAAAAAVAAAAPAATAVSVGASARGESRSSAAVRGGRLLGLRRQDLVPFLLAGRRVQHAESLPGGGNWKVEKDADLQSQISGGVGEVGRWGG